MKTTRAMGSSAAAAAAAMAMAAGLAMAAGCDLDSDGDDGSGGPDGELVALALCARGSEGGTVTELWAVDNGHGSVEALALAPTGLVALAGADGSIKVWTVEASGGALGSVPLEPGGVSAAYGMDFGAGALVRAVALAADGSRVLAGDDSGLVAIHDAFGGVLASTVPGTEPITAVALSDDGELIASADASFGGNLRLWRPGEPLADPLPTALWGAAALAFLPGSQDVLTAGDDYGIPLIELRRAADPNVPVASWEDFTVVGAGPIRGLDVSADGTRLVAAGGGLGAGVVASFAIAAMGADPAPASVVVEGHDPIAAALLPGDEVFATVGTEGTLRFWDVAGPTALEVVDLPAIPAGLGVDLSGFLLTAGSDDGTLRVYGCVN